jgi:hypothetical protein
LKIPKGQKSDIKEFEKRAFGDASHRKEEGNE